MPSIISIESITKSFPGVVALDQVSFDVQPGELRAIVGENGAGKSTLMKILAGVIPDFEGRLILRGNPTRFQGTREAEDAGTSIIHQELNLVENLSVTANIFLGREKRNALGFLNDKVMERAVEKLLVDLECNVQPRTLVRELRVGDQQLVEIAKALSREAEILIMDEPTSALTETEVARFYRVIHRLQQRHVTILYISHKLDEVFHLADRITVLRDGKHIKTLPRSQTNVREITHLMVGREIESVHFDAKRPTGDLVLEVENLSLPWVNHSKKWRLQNITFQLRRGEILGIAGLMGAGRTELLECLFGASPETPFGCMRLEGKEVRFTQPYQAREAGIALVTEDRKRLGLFTQMSVGENITICTLAEVAKVGLLSRRWEKKMAEMTINDLAIKAAGPNASINTLSGGNQQKAIIGRWLLTRPRVLLLDDPTRGVDVGGKAELYRLMDKLCRAGLGILVTSSELPELLTLCDRILVLCEGRLTADLPRHEATEQRIMEAATQRN